MIGCCKFSETRLLDNGARRRTLGRHVIAGTRDDRVEMEP